MFDHKLAWRTARWARLAIACGAIVSAGLSSALAAAPKAKSPEKPATGPIVAVLASHASERSRAIQDGMQEGLRRSGFIPGRTLRWRYQDAGGDASRLAALAQQVVADQPRVIVAVGEQAAAAIVSTQTLIPVVLSAVPDAVATNMLQQMAGSKATLTWVSDASGLERQIELIRSIAPQVRRIGVIYDPRDVESAALVKQLQVVLPTAGMTLVEAVVHRRLDVAPAARSLIEKVDAFFYTGDRQVEAAFPALVQVADNARIPLIARDAASVAHGAAAALVVNEREIGIQSGVTIARLLKGGMSAHIGPQSLQTLVLYVNPEAAKKQGIVLPADGLKNAVILNTLL